ncbi:Uncharacterised protein [Bordetella pertussis]|nr:Uncharacterised protein [Bordetella pertussis]
MRPWRSSRMRAMTNTSMVSAICAALARSERVIQVV